MTETSTSHAKMLAPSLRRHLPDALGLLLAALYGLPSLVYGFGRDQAIFFYIGREWLAGALPYSDSFDTKPPAIYLLHSILIALFGPHLATIRVAELVAVLAIGWLAVLVVHRETARRSGEIGLAAIVSASWYYTNFDYWDTGQVELWEGLCLLGAYVLIERGEVRDRAALMAGALSGLALAFKFTALPVSALLALVSAVRAYRAAPSDLRLLCGARALSFYGLGNLLVVGAFMGYFALNDEFTALVELMAYLYEYAGVWIPDDPGALILYYWTGAAPWAAACLGAWLFALSCAIRRRSRGVVLGALLGGTLLLSAIATVAIQRKYFPYHWGVITPFLVLIAAYGVAEGARAQRSLTCVAVAALVAVGFFAAPVWPANAAVSYRSYVFEHWRSYMLGEIGQRTFAGVFKGMANYSWTDHLGIAQRINELKRPDDLLHVRGFELGIYALTGLASPARFVSEALLHDPALAASHMDQAREHEQILWKTLPRFFVTFDYRSDDFVALRAHNYAEVTRSGTFVLFARGPLTLEGMHEPSAARGRGQPL